MKIFILMSSFVFLFQTWAFKPVSINQLNINYSNPSGQVNALLFSFDGESFDRPLVDVTREGANLRLAFENDDVIFEDVSDELLFATPFKLVNLNASSNASNASLTFESIRLKNPKSDVTANKFIMICDGATNQTEEVDKYMQSCTKNSIMNLSKVKMKSGGKTTEIKDIRMQSKNNKLLFSLDIGVKATGEGSIRYINNTNKKLIEVKIDRVKAGIFNVTRKFFEALDSMPDNVEVNRPYIYVHLDE